MLKQEISRLVQFLQMLRLLHQNCSAGQNRSNKRLASEPKLSWSKHSVCVSARRLRRLCMDNVFNRFARQFLVFVAALVFLAVSTLALIHGHVDSKSADESHCAMCVAVPQLCQNPICFSRWG